MDAKDNVSIAKVPRLSQQRFTANSRLVAESQDGILPQNRFLSVGNGSYTIKRALNEYSGFNYGFRVKFPRHADKSRGLRHFSNKVCEKVKEKGQTNYNEVADELVAEYFDSLPDPPSSVEKQQYDTKNIRRRVYDALNVLMAMNIIEKEKKEIHWVGLPTSSFAECRRLEEEKAQRQDRLRQKTEQLQELIIQLVAYKSLVQRNRERERTLGRPGDAAILYLPYIIVNTEKKTMVDCAISCDKTEYWFNFDRPFEIHDDIEVLKRLGLAYGLDSGLVAPENVTHVKNCLPPALRDYVDQIIEGTLAGGVINKSGKGSQTVVISANQQDRKPPMKFINSGGNEALNISGGSAAACSLPTSTRLSTGSTFQGGRSGVYASPSVPLTTHLAPSERGFLPSRSSIGSGQVARYAVIPRTISTVNSRYPPVHVDQLPTQRNYGAGYANNRQIVSTSLGGITAQQRHHYIAPSQSAQYSNGRSSSGYAPQRSYSGYQQEHRQPPHHQQQQIYHQEMQQHHQGIHHPEEYYEEDIYEEESQEY